MTKVAPKIDKVELRGTAPDTEYSIPFLQGMIDRVAVSYFKYGAIAVNAKFVDEIASLQERLQKYLDTGNTEWLIDVANFAMLEFMHPSHANAEYRATDTDESPGLTMKTGLRRK